MKKLFSDKPKPENVCRNYFILSALPILFWPFFFMAGLMSLVSLSGYRSGEESFLQLLVATLFIFATIFYPVIYFFSLQKCRKAANRERKLKLAAGPYLYILASCFLLMLWAALDQSTYTVQHSIDFGNSEGQQILTY